MKGSNASLTPSATALSIVAAASALITASIFARRHRDLSARLAKLEETRAAERKGRIRAEMKLRTQLKNGSVSNDLEASTEDRNDVQRDGSVLKHNLQLYCIGTVVSPYTKRMGTPRQGALVPSGRGYIQLRIPPECVEGLELYSHAWVLFTFHANTDTPSLVTNSNGDTLNLTKTKIRPPRGDGIKVGMLATRSPHRPNNIGLSLVQVVKVDKKKKRLHIAAFDLVNGTPVYDIKPVVPWDVPGHHDKVPLMVPSWVSQDDALQAVKFTPLAREALEKHVRNGKLSPLYTTKNDGLEGSIKSITEVLAQDPRASNTNSSNKRGSKDETAKNDAYLIVFCNVEIHFRVTTNDVLVEDVTKLDLETLEHVDGIPILIDR
jgi:tRNA-Thr(GGU) m(6)t(6)A37 methyltransferase TsaA